MTNNTHRHLVDLHATGLEGIFTKYIKQKIFHSIGFITSIIISLVCFVFLSFYSESDYYVLLSKIISLNISIFPNLLGFCIGGYALIIGFGHKEMLEKMSAPLSDEKSNMSYFQITSSIFAVSIIVQIVAFLASYFTSHIIDIGFYSSNNILCKYINISVITLILFLTVYSIFLLYYMVVNIFTFGQMMHFCIRKSLLDEEEILEEEIKDEKKL